MKNGQYEPPESIRPSLGGTEPFDALFERARRDAFTPEQSERLWQSVVSAGPGAGDAGPTLPEGPAPVWKSAAALKAAAVVVVGGALLAAAFAMHKSSGTSASVVTPSRAVESARGVEAPRVEGGPPTVSWEDLPPVRDEARPAASPPRGRAPSAQTPEPSPAPEPESTASAVAADPLEAAPASAAPVAQVPAPSEGALLLRARQQLASDPASALALTEEAGRRFPDGALAPEREVLAIESLARLGRLPAARARLTAFRAAYPGSPHLARLASLVGP